MPFGARATVALSAFFYYLQNKVFGQGNLEARMRWHDLPESENVEDRRQAGGGRFSGMPIRGRTGAILLIVVLVAGYFGYDLTPLLTGTGNVNVVQAPSGTARGTETDDSLAKFTSVALRTTEDSWRQLFHAAGREYIPATLVLYSGSTDTACGYGQSAMGPFYCPADFKVYMDLSFYRDMERKLGGGGDFALGYVLAHEVGHHVQNQLGITNAVRRSQAGLNRRQINQISVLNELQADCFAGVWGKMMHDRGILERGDLEEALNTAAAIGDDRLQRQSGGRVVPDSFTHGTSAQRLEWFRRGFDSGDPGQCNTFATIK